MLNAVKRLVFRVVLPVGLALLICTPTAQAQRRGTLVQQRSSGPGRMCGSGQLGSQSQLSTGYFQPQLYNQAFNQNQLYTNQALLSALQQQYALNALQQYVFQAQMLGTDPNDALQSALLAIQLNQLNAARLRAAQLQLGR